MVEEDVGGAVFEADAGSFGSKSLGSTSCPAPAPGAEGLCVGTGAKTATSGSAGFAESDGTAPGSVAGCPSFNLSKREMRPE